MEKAGGESEVERNMKYLGIDFGLSHLGFAVSDGEIAAPLKDNFTVDSSDEKSLQPVLRMIQQYKIENLVIGVVIGVIGEKARAFGEKLRNLTNLPVIYQDETLSSVRAVSQMVESGMRQSQRQTMDHNVAAANILQDYLDSLHEKKQV